LNFVSPQEATEIAGVDNAARAKKQGLKTRQWTSRHEEAGVDITRVDNVARYHMVSTYTVCHLSISL